MEVKAMHFRWLFFGAFFWSYAVVRVCAATTFFIPEPYGLGPPYLSFSDSPFNNLQWSYFYLEDFEDGLFNTPGVDDKPYNQRGPGPGSSVDKDDGVIDGTGSGGWSYGAALPGAVFNFDGPALGGFPTHVGLVLTKAYYMGVEAYMQVWDSSGQQLPRSLSTFMQVGPIGSTADDRFFGVIHSDGISKIVLSTGIYGMTIDHLQYGKIVTGGQPCRGQGHVSVRPGKLQLSRVTRSPSGLWLALRTVGQRESTKMGVEGDRHPRPLSSDSRPFAVLS
jgi:hypothetical protein